MSQLLMFTPVQEPTPVDEEDPGAFFERMWKSALVRINQHYTGMNNLMHVEMKTLPTETYLLAFQEQSQYDMHKTAGDLAYRIARRLTRMAEERHAPSGGNLTIDGKPILAKLFQTDSGERDWYEAFSPRKYWEALEAQFGGDAGEALAWSQTAGEIHDGFRLKEQTEIQRRAGYVVLTVGVWLESWRSTGKTLSHESAGRVCTTALALSRFAGWDDRHELSADLRRFARHYDTNTPISSRSKHGLGENGAEVVVVTFHTCFEFRMRPDVAERLQVFLATYRSVE